MPSERVRAWLVPILAILVAVLHVAHATGLRNLLAVLLAAFAAAMLIRGRHWPPLALPLLGWLCFGVLSSAWSANVEASLKSVLYDVVMPAGTFYSAFLVARRPSAPILVGLGALVGLAFLLAVTALAYAVGQAEMLRIHDPGGVVYYYPGPGAASTLAVYAVPVALLVAFAGDSKSRWIGYASLGCVPVIGLGTYNRMFWLALAAAVVCFALWQWQRFSRRQRRLILAGMVLGALAALAAVSYLSAKRGEERRLIIWREWGAIAAEAPLLGYGFGKRAIAEVGAPRLSRNIVGEDRNVLSHSHNLFLNVVLQTGVVGLALFGLLIGALLRIAYRARREPAHFVPGAALAALVVAMLVKNMTDDVMDHAVIVAFWLYAGLLAGRVLPLSTEASARPWQTDTNAWHPR